MASTPVSTSWPTARCCARCLSPTPDSASPEGGESQRHRIVIVGGGAGGLELATRLGDKLGKRGRADIILVDRRRAHLWKPLLHEIAAGSMDLGLHELDYLAQAHWHGFRYRVGALAGLDRTRREIDVAPSLGEDGQVVTPARRIGYDTLVIAIGSESNDFGTPGVAEHAIRLDTPDEAARFHRRLVDACIRSDEVDVKMVVYFMI
ncbi:MAG: FAD-dependent oxidoreductase, partial [Proteobacteria bacterium]|nr:FAD-dependent oxidoreductase [Pseudomonadota bacterium]